MKLISLLLAWFFFLGCNLPPEQNGSHKGTDVMPQASFDAPGSPQTFEKPRNPSTRTSSVLPPAGSKTVEHCAIFSGARLAECPVGCIKNLWDKILCVPESDLSSVPNGCSDIPNVGFDDKYCNRNVLKVGGAANPCAVNKYTGTCVEPDKANNTPAKCDQITLNIEANCKNALAMVNQRPAEVCIYDPAKGCVAAPTKASIAPDGKSCKPASKEEIRKRFELYCVASISAIRLGSIVIGRKTDLPLLNGKHICNPNLSLELKEEERYKRSVLSSDEDLLGLVSNLCQNGPSKVLVANDSLTGLGEVISLMSCGLYNPALTADDRNVGLIGLGLGAGICKFE